MLTLTTGALVLYIYSNKPDVRSRELSTHQ